MLVILFKFGVVFMKTAFKKSLALVLAAVMLLCALPFTASAATYIGTCGDNLTWSLDTDTGVLNITGTGAMYDYSYASVPWYSYSSYIKTVNIDNSVTTISNYAFYDCDSLTSVTIGNSVTTIGDYAFNWCTSLTSVTIGNSVTTIGNSAFVGCTSLTSITIPDSVTTIGENEFAGCDSLTSITIPNSVTTIGDYAFFGCHSLTSVTIGNSVTTIGYVAFYSCDSLTSVTIPDSVTTIGDSAFAFCTSLTSVTIGKNSQLTTIGNYAFSSCDSLTSVTIPDSVTTIGRQAFDWCTSLTSVTIPDSVTIIGNYAFYNCDSLTSVTIGNSVTTIDEGAFCSCDSLTDVYYTGTQAQWNKISIGSYNDPLRNATIHYNSTGPNNSFTYSQQHVVNNYKTANSDYAKMYLAGTAQPMDGSNGNPDLCIPGLKLGENMVPQGVAYYPAKNWLLISAYYNDGKKNSTVPSAVFALDMATGKMVGEYHIYKSEKDENGNEKPYTGHVGGIAVSDYNLYITSGSSIAYIPLSDLDAGNRLIIKDKTDLSAYLNQADASYISISDGLMLSGNFYYGSSTEYNKPAKDAKSVIIMQRLGGGSSAEEWAEVCDPGTSAVVKVPDSIDRIQGVAYRERKFYISSSFGRDNNSTLYTADLGASTLKKITKFKALPMMEGLTFAGDYIYAVHESAAAFYREGLDGKSKAKNPTDVVWKIDYKQLIDPYNLGEETYSFKNYSDNHSDGHCFAMSMTSAAYHMGILDITSIGGNIYDGLYALNDSATVRKPMCYYQGIQGRYVKDAMVAGGSAYVNWLKWSDIDSDWEEVVNYVKNHDYDNNGSLQICYGKSGQGAHGINFLRYEVVDGQERIYAYDNNFPDTEVYFYKSADGSILEAPKSTFSGAVTWMGLVNVETYFSVIGDYDSTRYIFADKDTISINSAIEYPLMCGDRERVVFEIPEGKEKVVITPLVENAEFEYLNVKYSFDQAAAGQIGEFTLAQNEETTEDTVELTFVDVPQSIQIKTPSVTTINYGETLVLQLEDVEVPEGWRVEWSIIGDAVTISVSEDGKECRVTSTASGNISVTATLVDENGEPVLNELGNNIENFINISSKAGFWQKLVSFFKNLFRINRIIY